MVVGGISELIDDITRTAQSNPGVNMVQVRTVLETTSSIMSVVLSVLLVLILIAVPLMVAVELLFLAVPALRIGLEKVEGDTAKHKLDLGVFLGDARKAIQREAEDNSKTATLHYFFVKLPAILATGTAVFLLTSGNDVIIKFVVRAVGRTLIGG
jgi:hypothetical protein